jgi:integrase/recombinase XerD
LFDQLFSSPSKLVRHRSARFLDERVRFLKHCMDRGTSRESLRKVALELLVIADQLDVRSKTVFQSVDVEDAAHRGAYQKPPRHKFKDAAKAKMRFVLTATRWLKFLGRLHSFGHHKHFIDEFASYLDRERGLSPMTIETDCGNVGRFLTRHCKGDQRLTDISIGQVDKAIAQQRLDGCSRLSIRTYANSLRGFLRYAETRGWCRKGLAAAIMTPRVYRNGSVPSGPSWEIIQKLLNSMVTDRAVDIRDRAVLMLFALYGLRSGEVQRLQLTDLDWEREVIRIVRPKPRSVQELPLTPTVGEAIIRYLKEVRSHRPSTYVFLTLHAPYSPLSRASLWNAVSQRLRPLNPSTRHQGPHSLRHACATRLLAQGLSLKEIGDHLGHRNPESTSIYAKVDFVGLRQVAEFHLGDVL